jgi:hypothetical protein
MQPLTHHEIIALVEPFSRRGRHVDLGASQRLERRLVFKPLAHGPQVLADLAAPIAQTAQAAQPAQTTEPSPPARPGEEGAPAPSGLLETLTLEQPYEGHFKLTRELRLTSGPNAGLSARLHAEGPDAGQLLQHLESVAPRRQFLAGEGCFAALSHRLDPRASGADLVFTEAVARVPGYTLTLRVPRVQGMSADVELTATPPGAAVALPEDLLAVIGWDWSPLQVRRDFWQGKVRLRGRGLRRSAGAEAKLARTLRHLGDALMRPPGEFHDRHRAARWGVVLRRGIPLLTVIGLFAGVAALPRVDLDEVSPLRMFAFHIPTLLLAIAFTMQELPRFEIPPWPRRLKMSAWTQPSTDASPDAPLDAPSSALSSAPSAAPSLAAPASAASTPPLEPTR